MGIDAIPDLIRSSLLDTLDTKPRILILTAGFGEGHNSAARNLGKALQDKAHVRICDPCELGNPRINEILKKGYRFIITHTPRIWQAIYQSTDRQDFSKPFALIQPTEDALGKMLQRVKPHLIICTYPLYPYQLKRLFQQHSRAPVVTVITDSMEINAAWSQAPSDHFIVTDNDTAGLLEKQGIARSKIQVTGFPVSPRFPLLNSLYSTDEIRPFRVLFFPTRRMPQIRKIMRAVLNVPGTEITLVLGRSFRPLYRKAREISKAYPGRVHLKGWTKKVPELLCSHHIVIGKAGGATVHESLAARCPMLVHHRVPGQEEGNIRLLEKYQAGHFTPTPEDIATCLKNFLENDGALWRQTKERLLAHSRPAGALDAADFVINLLDPPENKVWGLKKS